MSRLLFKQQASALSVNPSHGVARPKVLRGQDRPDHQAPFRTNRHADNLTVDSSHPVALARRGRVGHGSPVMNIFQNEPESYRAKQDEVSAMVARIMAAHSRAAANSSAFSSSASLTYLEINGWLLTEAGVTVLIDPVLEGPLDFGISALYTAMRRVLPDGLISHLPQLDALIITQGLDDHAHARTLTRLAQLDKDLPVIASPSARPVLERCGFSNVRYIFSQEQNSQGMNFAVIRPRRPLPFDNSPGLHVRATSGALVGPPWQRRENGYVLRPAASVADSDRETHVLRPPAGITESDRDTHRGPSIYIEPHVEFDKAELARLAPVDALITPVSGQTLPGGFELVRGSDASATVVGTLRPRWVLPMRNGAIDTTGLVAPLVSEVGSDLEFAAQLGRAGIEVEVLDVRPGEPLTLTL